MATSKESLQVQLELKDKITNVLKKLQKQAKTTSKGFKDSFANAFKEADKQADKMIATIGKISKAIAGIGTIAIGAVTVKGMTDYISIDEQLAKTASVGGFDKYSEDYKRIEELSAQLGATTSKTQAEVAEAMEKMYLAGWNTDEVTSNIGDMLKFALANGEDLVTVVDLVTDSTGATGLAIEDLSTFFDQLTKGSTKANATVSEFLESTLKSGAGLSAINTDLENMITLQGILANSGFKGGESGTALNSLSNRLYKSTGEGAKGRQILGISVENVDGTVKSFDALMREISQSIKGRSEAEINEAFTYLFGEYKAQGLAIIKSMAQMEDGSEELIEALNRVAREIGEDLDGIDLSDVGAYDELLNEIKNAEGSVDFKYSIMTDTLAEDLNSLKSAFSGFSVAFMKPFGEKSRGLIQKITTKLNEMTEKAGELAEAIIDKVSKAFDFFKEHKETIISLTAGVVTFVGAFIGVTKGAKALEKINKIFKNLKITPIKDFATFLSSLIMNYALGGGKVSGCVEVLKSLGSSLVSLLNPINLVKKVFTKLKLIFMANPFMFIVSVIALVVAGLVMLYKKSETFRNKVHEVFNSIKARLSEFGQKMVELYEERIKPLWDKIKSIFVDGSGEVQAIWVTLGTVLMDTIDIAIDFILSIVEFFVEHIINSIEFCVDIFQGLIDFIAGVFTLDWERAWEGIKGIFGGVFDFIKNSIKNILGLFDNLADMAKKTWEKIKGWLGIGGDIERELNATKDIVVSYNSNLTSTPNSKSSAPTDNTIMSKIPHNALGTSYFKGGLTQINERGGELQILPNGTSILPADKTEKLVEGSSGGIVLNINIDGNVIGEDSYINKLGSIITQKIGKQLSNLA